MAKVFVNTLATYVACLEISQMYQPVAANIDIGCCPYRNFPKLLCMKKLENQISVQFCLILKKNMTTIYIYICMRQ